uniref:Ovule protein n=1 Tax=Heterorhabditis bacteriophora TaxID=37862 RepID=A0A1I7WF31_HETBA
MCIQTNQHTFRGALQLSYDCNCIFNPNSCNKNKINRDSKRTRHRYISVIAQLHFLSLIEYYFIGTK